MKDRYFLVVELAGEKIEKEVSLEEYCKAERQAGFRPKMASDDLLYMTTPATAAFGCFPGVCGHIKYGG
jgi:hypothetical protein